MTVVCSSIMLTFVGGKSMLFISIRMDYILYS